MTATHPHPSATRPRARTVPAVLAACAVLLAAGCQPNHRLTAAQIAVLKAQGFQEKDDNWELNLTDKLLFDVGSDRIKPETEAGIQHVGGALGAVGIHNIQVNGYTDGTGTDEFNNALSQRRAAMVARALSATGVVGTIAAHGMGKRNPIAPNTTDAGRAENRRVAIVVPSEQG